MLKVEFDFGVVELELLIQEDSKDFDTFEEE